MENIETNFDDFFGSFEGADGNQTDTAEVETEETETDDAAEEGGEEVGYEAAEGSEDSGNSEGENTKESSEEVTETKTEPEKPISEQKFVVKVNKETREVSYQDAPAWIQKGMDYDRVKGKLDEVQTEYDKYKPHIEILEQAAEAAGTTVESMLEAVQIGMLKHKHQGMTDSEARAELRNIRLEKQIQSMSQQKQQPAQDSEKKSEPDEKADRAQRDIEEFTRYFPNVQLTEELVNKLVPDVQKGMSLTSAYLKQENERLVAAAKQQQAEADAKAKNKHNRANTPGSQRDSGGSKTKSTFDDFFGAFEK